MPESFTQILPNAIGEYHTIPTAKDATAAATTATKFMTGSIQPFPRALFCENFLKK